MYGRRRRSGRRVLVEDMGFDRYAKIGGGFHPRPTYLSKAASYRSKGRVRAQWNPVRQELKFHDLDTTDAVVAAGGTIAVASCNLIAQGTTEVERLGRRCVIMSISWRFRLTLPAVAGSTLQNGDSIRVILYLDKQANGATATVTDILETSNFFSFNNLANKGRFRILMNRQYTLNLQAGAGDGTANDSPQMRVLGTFNKKCNIPIEFSGTSGVITEVRSSNIGVLLVGQAGLGSFDGKMRLRFHD